MLYARVEHKELWAIIVILLTSMSYFDSAVLLDEAAQTDAVFSRTTVVLFYCRNKSSRNAMKINGEFFWKV